jgi:hypothetical protein
MTVGIPNGRRLVLLPLFGMYTRLTGSALNGSALCWTLSTNCILASGVSATSPSTPAVRRPALRSVTRRTLISVFARERSINFCNRRTLAGSPALLAVKIRCRNRRTSASARRQSIWRQRRASSSGPLTTPTGAVAASSLSFGSGVINHFLFTGSPDRVSTLSGSGTMSRIRPVIQGRPAGGASHHVPVSYRLSAAGIRFSVIRFPPRDRLSSRSAHRPKRPDPDGVTASRTHELRPGWVPPIPRGQWCSPGRVASPTGTRRFPAAVPLPRHDIPPCEASHHEASTGVQSRSPVRSSPRPRPRGRTRSASAFPRASHPTVTGSARQGRGQAIEHGPGTTLTTSVEPPILRAHSMRAASRRTANCETSAVKRCGTSFVLAGVRNAVPLSWPPLSRERVRRGRSCVARTGCREGGLSGLSIR